MSGRRLLALYSLRVGAGAGLRKDRGRPHKGGGVSCDAYADPGVARKLYRDYPNLVDNLRESDIEYNRECDELAKLKEAGRIFMICPSEPPAVGRIEKDMEKLGELYYLGYNDAMRCMDALKAYLGAARR